MSQTSLLITDLDGTLAGDAAALSHFKTFMQGFEQPPRLVYVTGRHLDSARELIATDQLPQPHLLVTDIGAAIYAGATLQEDERWAHRMHHRWDPQAITDAAQDIPALTLQQLPNTKRVSFTTTDAESVTALKAALEDRQLAHTLIYSADRYVDVLPEGGGKGTAVTYVIEDYFAQSSDVLIAGDSGNDTAMLSLGYPAVVVGNAHPELDHLTGHSHVYRSKATHAAGIVEAWGHFHGSPLGQRHASVVSTNG